MTQSRLNNLFILYIHPTKIEDLDLSQIAKEFISVNTKRLNILERCNNKMCFLSFKKNCISLITSQLL